MPPRNTPEYYAMGLIDQILVQGKDSRLHQSLVQDKGLTGEVAGGINLLGHQFNISGPVGLDVYVFHDKDKTADQILAAVDAEVQKLQTAPVDTATLDRARVKVRSALYDAVDGFFGFGRADLLASYALFDDDPSKINAHRGRVREGDARAHPEGRARVPAHDEPHRAHHRPEEGREGRRCRRRPRKEEPDEGAHHRARARAARAGRRRAATRGRRGPAGQGDAARSRGARRASSSRRPRASPCPTA